MKNPEKKHEHRRWIACDIEQEYFGEDRKSAKMERKKATAKDRSQYKKSDLSKRQRQEINPDWKRGRVLSIVPEGILVAVQEARIVCSLRGALKKTKSQLKNLVAVGDEVYFEEKTAGQGLIMAVEPRRTVLSRADNLSRRKEQLIAANIDQVLITTSVVAPALKPSLVDRYIIATEKGNMQPIVIVNKIDLLEKSDDPVIKAQRELFKAFLDAYQKAGIPVIAVSAATGEGIEALKAAMKDKSSVFSGQSGVGKSSLINAVTDYQLEVGEMVERTQKGSHTTTTARLLPLSFGGWCIDTPGIRSFGIWELHKEELESYFSEIFTAGRQCRFPDCSHRQESECAVMKAVESGEISPIRYLSYLTLMESITETHLRR
jgi:ribosome biogenesis GTPase / thiamine phosphate phosphatase